LEYLKKMTLTAFFAKETAFANERQGKHTDQMRALRMGNFVAFIHRTKHTCIHQVSGARAMPNAVIRDSLFSHLRTRWRPASEPDFACTNSETNNSSIAEGMRGESFRATLYAYPCNARPVRASCPSSC